MSEDERDELIVDLDGPFSLVENKHTMCATMYERLSEGTPLLIICDAGALVGINNVQRLQDDLETLPKDEPYTVIGERGAVFFATDAIDDVEPILGYLDSYIEDASDLPDEIVGSPCVICGEPRETVAGTLSLSSESTSFYVHEGCLNEMIAMLDDVWRHTNEVLPATL